MDIETFRSYCLAIKGTEETFPFDEYTLVYKVMGKMYAATGLDEDEFRINLKCDPWYAVELREQYPDIIPGYHMNKKHWNTIYCERELEEPMIYQLIDHSYRLVVSGLKKADRAILDALDS